MLISAPATIDSCVFLIGNIGFPAVFVTAGINVMFEAGVSIMGPVYVDELRQRLEHDTLDMLFVTHSHYDHIGSCEQVRQAFPDLRVAGHALIQDVVKNPRAISTMKDLSNVYRELLDMKGPSTEFIPPKIDILLKDGDEIDLGKGITVKVLQTPGHTRDSMTFIIEPSCAAVVGEALGIALLDGTIYPEFLTDFNAYVESAMKIIDASPRMLLFPHGPSMTGEDAETFLKGVIPAAFDWKDMISEALNYAGGDIEASTSGLFSKLYDPSRIGQEMNAFRTNLRAKVACIAKLG
jgi:2-aminobenzoylacetyl-CoA thioesterase